jgi:hypothetical protein
LRLAYGKQTLPHCRRRKHRLGCTTSSRQSKLIHLDRRDDDQMRLCVMQRGRVTSRLPFCLETVGARLHFLNPNKIVKFFLANGADIAARDGDQRTSLHLDSLLGDEVIFQLLLSNRADIEAQDQDQRTSLLYRDTSGLSDVYSRMVHITAREVFQRTLPHFASRKGHREIVKVLLGSEIDRCCYTLPPKWFVWHSLPRPVLTLTSRWIGIRQICWLQML